LYEKGKRHGQGNNLKKSVAVGLDTGVSGWYQGQYGKCHVLISYDPMVLRVLWYCVFTCYFNQL
jgi:hypothetical protein